MNIFYTINGTTEIRENFGIISNAIMTGKDGNLLNVQEEKVIKELKKYNLFRNDKSDLDITINTFNTSYQQIVNDIDFDSIQYDESIDESLNGSAIDNDNIIERLSDINDTELNECPNRNILSDKAVDKFKKVLKRKGASKKQINKYSKKYKDKAEDKIKQAEKDAENTIKQNPEFNHPSIYPCCRIQRYDDERDNWKGIIYGLHKKDKKKKPKMNCKIVTKPWNDWLPPKCPNSDLNNAPLEGYDYFCRNVPIDDLRAKPGECPVGMSYLGDNAGNCYVHKSSSIGKMIKIKDMCIDTRCGIYGSEIYIELKNAISNLTDNDKIAIIRNTIKLDNPIELTNNLEIDPNINSHDYISNVLVAYDDNTRVSLELELYQNLSDKYKDWKIHTIMWGTCNNKCETGLIGIKLIKNNILAVKDGYMWYRINLSKEPWCLNGYQNCVNIDCSGVTECDEKCIRRYKITEPAQGIGQCIDVDNNQVNDNDIVPNGFCSNGDNKCVKKDCEFEIKCDENCIRRFIINIIHF